MPRLPRKVPRKVCEVIVCVVSGKLVIVCYVWVCEVIVCEMTVCEVIVC